jgi:hypothetical protein
MPYFSIKVFQVVMGCLTTLGFYSCLPNVRLWIETHQFFPMKKELLLLENQTLELFVFSILLTSILVKLYVVIIVWYCYRYMVTIKSFVNMSGSSTGVIGSNLTGTNMAGVYSFNDNSVGYKIDDESLISQPPKYEEIIKQIKRESNENNNTSNLTSNPTTSSNIADVIVPLREETSTINEITSQNNSPPSYVAVLNNKPNINGQSVI